MSGATMNRPGPLARDWRRLMIAAKRFACTADYTIAQTGTVYVTVTKLDEDDCYDEERTYRFASHGEAHTSHDYSVASGSTVPRTGTSLPPGYDGWLVNAIEDLKGWAIPCDD